MKRPDTQDQDTITSKKTKTENGTEEKGLAKKLVDMIKYKKKLTMVSTFTFIKNSINI